MITLACEICGGQFEVKQYRAKTARFCSKKCAGVWHAKTRLPSVVSKAMKGNTYRAGKRPANAFDSGNTPWNKNKKGIHLSPHSEFRKGCKSNRIVPVGTTRIRKTKKGVLRAFVKVADPNVWKLRSVVSWESVHGTLPPGLLVHHKDRDTLNDNPTNLEAMTRAQHIEEHRQEF